MSLNFKRTSEEMIAFETAHFRKIDMSDGIYVVNIGGYIGQAVRNEIEYAQKHNTEFRNRGIGSAVIKKCCMSVNEPVILYVFIRNERAVSLYKRLEFKVIETIGDSRYIMR